MLGASAGVFYAVLSGMHRTTWMVEHNINEEWGAALQAPSMDKMMTLYLTAPLLGWVFGLISLALRALLAGTALSSALRFVAAIGVVLFPLSLAMLFYYVRT